MKINHQHTALGSDHNHALLKRAKMNSLLLLPWLPCGQKQWTICRRTSHHFPRLSPGASTQHLIRNLFTFQAPSTPSPRGRWWGLCTHLPACLPRNTLKSLEFKYSSRRSLRAPRRCLWSFTENPVPPGFPHNTAASWWCIEQLRENERLRQRERETSCRHCK